MPERDLDLTEQRRAMVRDHLKGRGITDARVLDAFTVVPRELFVRPGDETRAYADSPLPIGGGQTISQPYVVAAMVQALALEGGETVLEVGAGSGYAAAILGQLARRVIAVERDAALAARAAATLAAAGAANVEIVLGDGSIGRPDDAPFGGILVSAGAPRVPDALVDQLAVGGRLVVPVGDRGAQRLVVVERTGEGDVTRRDVGLVRFVPLVGEGGWKR